MVHLLFVFPSESKGNPIEMEQPCQIVLTVHCVIVIP